MVHYIITYKYTNVNFFHVCYVCLKTPLQIQQHPLTQMSNGGNSFTNIRRFCGCGTGQSVSRPISYRFVYTNLWRNNGQRNAPVPHLCLYKKSAKLCLFMDCLAKKVLGGSSAQIALLLSSHKNTDELW